MKKIILTVFFALISFGFILVSSNSINTAYAGSGNCYLCGSGSSMNQCQYCGSDTFAQRKKCKAAGCKVTGTASCSTAANVKVGHPNGC